MDSELFENELSDSALKSKEEKKNYVKIELSLPQRLFL